MNFGGSGGAETGGRAPWLHRVASLGCERWWQSERERPWQGPDLRAHSSRSLTWSHRAQGRQQWQRTVVGFRRLLHEVLCSNPTGRGRGQGTAKSVQPSCALMISVHGGSVFEDESIPNRTTMGFPNSLRCRNMQRVLLALGPLIWNA